MRLICEYDLNRSVTYHGIPLLVPEHINFITTDDDGTVHGWELIPTYSPYYAEWVSRCCERLALASVELDGMPPHATLIEVRADG